MTILLDASALLAFIFEEAGETEVRQAFKSGAAITTVNIAEVAMKMLREGYNQEEVEILLPTLPLMHVNVDNAVAYQSAFIDQHTKKFGLSLGDRICLAAAWKYGYIAMTADQSWKKVKLDGVQIKCIR
jgi:ribonuclease VapC